MDLRPETCHSGDRRENVQNQHRIGAAVGYTLLLLAAPPFSLTTMLRTVATSLALATVATAVPHASDNE